MPPPGTAPASAAIIGTRAVPAKPGAGYENHRREVAHYERSIFGASNSVVTPTSRAATFESPNR